jgi:hypothetical protein
VDGKFAMIRPANFSDIPAIVTLVLSGFEQSHYAKEKEVGVHVPELKKLLVAGVGRHGYKNGGGTWVQVAETEGVVTGFIFGTLARVYAIGDKLMATDLFWYCNPVTSPKDAVGLLDGMREWAKSCPDVVEIKCGATAALGDPERVGKLLVSKGFEPYGGLYRQKIERNSK